MNKDIDPIEAVLKALSFRERSPRQGETDACPSDEAFAAFMDSLLPESEAAGIKSHIVTCPECHLAYTAWMEASAIEGLQIPPHLIESAKARFKFPKIRVAIRLLKKSFEILNPTDVEIISPLSLEPAAVCRGEFAVKENRFELVEMDPRIPDLASIRIQHLEEPGSLKVTVIPSKGLDEDRMERTRIDLFRGDNLIQSWPLYRSGTALNPIEKGSYRLGLVELSSRSDQHEARSLGSVDLNLS